MRVDRDELAARGVTVVRDVAPEALLAPARDAVHAFLGDPVPPVPYGVVPLHHGQALWDLRQHPPLHAVFAEVFGHERLWVSMDRAIYRAAAGAPESALHWDVDPRIRGPHRFQGMLFLTDGGDDGAPFECVPSLYAALPAWLAAHPGLDLEAPIDLGDHVPETVAARAGDLVLWDVRLPHRGAPNRGGAPRMSFAVTMWEEGGDDERAERVTCWRDNRIPRSWSGWPGVRDPEPGPAAGLTPLGRRLVGLDRWAPTGSCRGSSR
ncbi:MAG: hypothetical protein R3F59_08315 [Myxococcota bacterium]